jgi:hypothetical protein
VTKSNPHNAAHSAPSWRPSRQVTKTAYQHLFLAAFDAPLRNLVAGASCTSSKNARPPRSIGSRSTRGGTFDPSFRYTTPLLLSNGLDRASVPSFQVRLTCKWIRTGWEAVHLSLACCQWRNQYREFPPLMSNVWYEDPKTGDIYQDHTDSSKSPHITIIVSSGC